MNFDMTIGRIPDPYRLGEEQPAEAGKSTSQGNSESAEDSAKSTEEVNK